MDGPGTTPWLLNLLSYFAIAALCAPVLFIALSVWRLTLRRASRLLASLDAVTAVVFAGMAFRGDGVLIGPFVLVGLVFGALAVAVWRVRDEQHRSSLSMRELSKPTLAP